MKENNISIIGNKCCGCGACLSNCPKDAIISWDNDEGFSYPKIDTEQCVNCGKCLESCPINKVDLNDKCLSAYALYSKNERDLLTSTSGGFFGELSAGVIKKGGVVYGCSMVDLVPKHIRIDKIEDIDLLRGSKYVQSMKGEVYSYIKKDLSDGKIVLFSGTPCETAAVNNLFKSEYDNLITVDFICHGVPSRKLFSDYLQWQEKKNHFKIDDYCFRSKDRNGWSYTLRVRGIKKNGNIKKLEKKGTVDPYYYAFLKGMTSRLSCYECPFATIYRNSDITMGDFWRIKKYCPEMFNENGVSAALINTAKGAELFDSIRNSITVKEVDTDNIVNENKHLSEKMIKPMERDNIYKDELDKGFDYVAKKYMRHDRLVIEKIKDIIGTKKINKIKSIINK